MLGYFLYRIGEFLACSFSLGTAYKISAFFANAQFLFSKKDRIAVMNNLSIILPHESKAEIRRKTREVFLNFGRYLAEFFRYKKINQDFLKERVICKGWEHVDASLQNGKGAILLTAHLGNWELGGMAFGILGYPIAAVALDHQDKRINDFFRIRREGKGVEIIPLGVAVRRCFKALKQNKLVAILGDRDFSNTGYSIHFLGREKKIPRGPAVLALHTGAPIVPVFVTRGTNNHITVECLPPITFSSDHNEIDVMRRYASIIEEQIRKYPTQWLMFREFWKE